MASYYEQQRLENIKRNEAYLNSLNVQENKPKIELKKEVKRKRNPPKISDDVQPSRRSRRNDPEYKHVQLDYSGSGEPIEVQSDVLERNDTLVEIIGPSKPRRSWGRYHVGSPPNNEDVKARKDKIPAIRQYIEQRSPYHNKIIKDGVMLSRLSCLTTFQLLNHCVDRYLSRSSDSLVSRIGAIQK